MEETTEYYSGGVLERYGDIFPIKKSAVAIAY